MKEGGHVIPLEEKSPRRQHKKVLALFLSAIQHFLRRCSVLISVYVYFLPLKRLNCRHRYMRAVFADGVFTLDDWSLSYRGE